MSGGGQKSTFSQPNWKVDVGRDFVQAAGDVHLTNASTKEDLAREIEALRREVAKLAGVDPERRAEAERDLAAAAREAQREQPAKNIIASRLETASQTLEAANKSAEGLEKVLRAIARIATWVGGAVL